MNDRLAQERAQLIHGLNGHDVDADMGWSIIHRWDALVEIAKAAREALDCKGPYNGTVSERGGEPALCAKCEERLNAALSVLDDREAGETHD